MTPYAIGFVLLLVIAGLVGGPLFAAYRRRKARDMPFPAAWREIIDRRVPLARNLPPSLRLQLEARIQVFLLEKNFIGCDDVAITDEMRITIAAQACLLVLNRKSTPYPNLRQILVYPGAFLVDRIRPEPSGILQEERRALSGESWTQGQVVLSWEDTLNDAAIADDGRNVVIHEFAHQLDQEKGYANGAPWLGNRDRYPSWSQVLAYEFAMLQQAAFTGQPSLLNHYGATNPAEFFAVATEVFFEQPQAMAHMHPALYAEFANLYRVDPAQWPRS
ncbi:zinc-dependent peptidase [Usitatibacter palustris]|uniref:Protein MtfA n=1 Tax=Usitatibacter palustris TaxID=2732487 RepID=A0A6M4H897_9PROT|nr:M90 family metallopeptidase [Usitatibacter palustris]QJR14933.1 Protein MtfA [Usitatibacter palustris]